MGVSYNKEEGKTMTDEINEHGQLPDIEAGPKRLDTYNKHLFDDEPAVVYVDETAKKNATLERELSAMTTPTPQPLKPCAVSARRSMSMDVIDKLCANCPNRKAVSLDALAIAVRGYMEQVEKVYPDDVRHLEIMIRNYERLVNR